MNLTKFVAIFVTVIGILFYLYSYFNPPETWESHNEKGVSAFHESRYADAEMHFVQADKLAKKFPPHDRRLNFGLNQLAEIYRIQAKFVQAETILKRIITIDEEKFGSAHPNVAYGLNNLAGNYLARGKYNEAEALLKRALIILEESFGREHPLVGNIVEHYARLLNKMGRSAEAEMMEKRYLAIYSSQGL